MYLGSTLSREANIDVEVNNRLSKASSAFGRLRKKVWERRGISQDTKLKVYMDMVLTVLPYACETWTVYSRHARKLNHFHTKCLRIILSVKWQDMVPDTEVLTRAGIPSIHTLLQKAQVRWAGQVTRMPDDSLPKQLLYGELCYGKRSVGGQKKPLRRPSQDLTSMSPTGKPVPRINPCGAVWFIPEQEQLKKTGSRTLRKSVQLTKRDFTLPPAPQPARHTHAPNVEECYRPELDRLATSAHTGPTNHNIIIIIIGEVIHRKRWTNKRRGDVDRHVWAKENGCRNVKCEVLKHFDSVSGLGSITKAWLRLRLWLQCP